MLGDLLGALFSKGQSLRVKRRFYKNKQIIICVGAKMYNMINNMYMQRSYLLKKKKNSAFFEISYFITCWDLTGGKVLGGVDYIPRGIFTS
jgi:hypothetical protein